MTFPIITVDDIGHATGFSCSTFGFERTFSFEEIAAPADQAWGERICTFGEADGHLLHIGPRS